MTEYDLRKLPVHRMMEAKEKAKIILFQRAYDRKIKINEELVKKVNEFIDEKMNEYWVKKGSSFWMDFGDKFIKEVIDAE